MHEILKELGMIGILPVIKIDWKAWSIPKSRSLLRKIYHTSCKILFGSGYGPRTRLRGGEYNKFPLQRRYSGACSWVLHYAEKALPLAKTLLSGGIPCAEITFRMEAGEESIRRIHKGISEILLGAGMVLAAEQIDRAVDAGTQFIVSPGLNSKVVSYCADIETALEYGLDVIKFFPAESSGGLPISRPLPRLTLH
jgi:hypothetical protein